MAYKITDPTGFIDSDGKNAFESVSVVAETGAKLGTYSRPTSVLWRRNNAFSTAELEIIDARIVDANRLGSGIDVGEPVKIKADTDFIFAGYVMKQSMSAAGGTGTTKQETVKLQCIDYRYDLLREVIIGQIGVQANGDTGEEATEDGPYGGGVAWFSGLRCVFNDRTFAKNIETAIAKDAVGDTKLGNGRTVPSGAFSSLGGDKPTKIFDGNYHVLNLEGGDPAEIVGDGRVNAWSAWDMIKYVLAYCYDPPFSKEEVMGADKAEPVFVESTRIVLSASPNGMTEIFPVNVDVQGLDGVAAITKICAAAGYSWWLEPDSEGGASKIVVWRTGSPGSASKSFYMGSGGSGVPRGLYRNLTAPLDYPLITTKWNVDEINVDIDYTRVVGTLIGTTQNIRVQNVFFLVKGWANSVFFRFVTSTAIEAKKTLSGSADKEAKTFTFKEGKDTAGQTIRYFIHKLGSNVTISLDRDGSSEGLLDGDTIASIFRRWITDDTGIVKTPDDKERAPYKFHVAGLTEENGGLYMVKPRPFLSTLLSAPDSGDKRPPKIGFPKFDPEQASVIFTSLPDETEIRNKRGEIARDRAKLDAAGKKFYPFGSKKGQIRILRETSGCFIEGGFLDLQNVTIDAKTNKITMFNPAALAAVEHDQAKLVVSSCITTIGDIKPSRRWIDGRKFVVDRIYAEQFNDTPSPDRVDEGDDPVDVSAGDVDAIDATDESAKFKDELDESCGYYSAPKASMRVKIPALTTAYKPSEKIVSVEGASGSVRLALEGASNTVVGVQFNLLQRYTTVSVESERLNQRGLNVLAERGQ